MSLKRPKLEVLSGAFHEDHWLSPSAAILVTPGAERRTIRGVLWNPYFNPQYLRNRVMVTVDGERVFHDLVFAGGALRIERDLAPREELLLEIESEAAMDADPLDDRPRGMRLKLMEIVRA